MPNIIKAQVEVMEDIESILSAPKDIEIAGRTCYKSEIGDAEDFCKMLIKRGHESVLEHAKITIRFICDRGVSHELVRHRIASFSQESTRYCNYSKDKFDNQVTFIDIRPGMHIEGKMSEEEIQAVYKQWRVGIMEAEKEYFALLNMGCTPQIARSLLPNSTATTIVTTMNVRQWREVFRQRTAKAAHPQMRELMVPLLMELQKVLPCLFEDITLDR